MTQQEQQEATLRVVEFTMRQADRRLPDAASTLFAAWMSLVHAEGLPPTVQAALINSAALQLNQAVRAFNEKNPPPVH